MKFLFDSRFGPLYWTQFFGALNDNIFKNALIIYATYKGLSLAGLPTHQLVAAAGGIFILPFFLFSALAGEIADKYEKSRVVQITKITEITIMILGAIGFFTNSVGILMSALFLMGCQSTFFGPLKYSMLPELVSGDDLVKANARVLMGTYLAILVGTIAGGVFANLKLAPYIITTSVLIVGFIGFLASLKIPALRRGNPGLHISFNPFPTIKNNFLLLRENRSIFNAVLGISWFWFFGAGVLSLLPIYGKDYLYVDGTVVTLFLAMFTLGVGIGSFVCEKVSNKRIELGIVPIGALGMSIFIVDIFFVVPSWSYTDGLMSLKDFVYSFEGQRLCLDFFFMSVFAGIFIVPLNTFIQDRSHKDNRSRIVAGNNVLNALFMVISSLLLMGFYAINMTPPEIFLAYALLNVLVSIYIYSVVPEFTLRFYSWCLVHFIYKLKLINTVKIPETGPAILTCNHVSFVDWLLIAGASRRPVRFIMYYKFFEIPLVRFLMKHAQVIPIAGAKEHPEILENAFRQMDEALQAGELICIFPEGRLTPDGGLMPFRPGLLRILKQNPVPVVPMVIRGLWGGLFTRKKDGRRSLFRKTIELEVSDPILPSSEFNMLVLENKTRQMLGLKPIEIVAE